MITVYVREKGQLVDLTGYAVKYEAMNQIDSSFEMMLKLLMQRMAYSHTHCPRKLFPHRMIGQLIL